MRPTHTLSLRGEALTELTPDELRDVVAGDAITTGRGCRIASAVILVTGQVITILSADNR